MIEETIHRAADDRRYEYFPCDFDLRDIGLSYSRGITLRVYPQDRVAEQQSSGRIEIYFLLRDDNTTKATEVMRYLNHSIRKCCVVYPTKGNYDPTVS
jgi:hypothetical protein